jgi:hypothetical protein
MTDNYHEEGVKNKLVALRISEHRIVQLKAIVEKNNAGLHYYGKTTVSKLICAAIEDFVEGKTDNQDRFKEHRPAAPKPTKTKRV